MEPPHICIFVILIHQISQISSAFPPTLRNPTKAVPNRISSLQTQCDAQYLNVTLSTEQPFKGAIFAKDFAQECISFGTLTTSLQVNLPTFGCGVRLTSTSNEDGTVNMYYIVSVVLQQDRYLRQIFDQEALVKCEVKEEAFLLKSKSLFNELKKEIGTKTVNHRVGRFMNEDWSKDLSQQDLEEELNQAMSAARAWMEIMPENNLERNTGTVEVGEMVLLTVKSTLPAGIGWRIVDCTAHDGLGDSSQRLLDEEGCPLDEALLPLPKFGQVKPIASMRHQEAVARFAAFKFPDRDRLHLQCRLQVCRGACDKVDCVNRTRSENRIGRHFGGEGEVLDRLEVYNSVQVIAPEIDDANEFRKKMQSADFDSYPFPKIPGDRTFCVSIDKMAIAFCILGVIFLVAVLVAACSLLKNRRSQSEQYYTRSLFSSSSSGGSNFGSKLLLQDSPVFGHSSSTTSNRMQYGRIL